MSAAPPEIGVATRDDVARLVDWAAGEGWNPGRADAECFRAADPGGFLVATTGGEMAAGVSVVRYDADFAFLGLFICRPDLRGRGFGRAVWEAGIALAEHRTIGLDGVAAQVGNYRAQGFAPAFRTVRFAGPSPSAAPDARVRPVDGDIAAAVAALDARCFGARRSAFLDAWLGAEGHVARALVEDGRLRGFAVARPCREGAKIGPLFAETSDAAEALIRALAGVFRDGIVLDAPEANPAAAALARRLGLVPAFETTRMYRGPAPAQALDQVFGLTTLELG